MKETQQAAVRILSALSLNSESILERIHGAEAVSAPFSFDRSAAEKEKKKDMQKARKTIASHI